MIEIIFGSIIYTVALLGCHDGDTCKVKFSEEDIAVPFMQEKSLRFDGFDTPNLRGRCARERKLAKEARQVTRNYFFKSTKRSVSTEGKLDQYKRLLVKAPELEKILISKGLAYEYHGGKKRSWCN